MFVCLLSQIFFGVCFHFLAPKTDQQLKNKTSWECDLVLLVSEGNKGKETITVAPLECDDWSSCNWCLAFQKKAPHAKKLWISLNLWMGFGVLFSEPPKQIVGLKRAAPNPSPSPAVPISPLLLKYWRWPLSLIFILLLFVLSFMRRRLITN